MARTHDHVPVFPCVAGSTFPLLLLLLVGCEEPSRTTPAPSASADVPPVQFVPLPKPVVLNTEGRRQLAGKEESVILLTINEAREVLYDEGWGRAEGDRTASGFTLSKEKDGRTVKIEWLRFNDGQAPKEKLAKISQNALWAQEQTDAAVAVSITKEKELDVKATEALLKKLVVRGAQATPTFTLVPASGDGIAPALSEDGRSIAPATVEAVVKALEKAGHAGGKVTQQTKDDPEGDRVAMPSALITAGEVEVMVRCARPRTSLRPKPIDAGVGGSISLQGTCAVIVWVGRTDDKPSDKRKAETLLKRLLG
ncbi:MAG: hypothetical protein AAGA56_29475 [Myxococcota bacterium]